MIESLIEAGAFDFTGWNRLALQTSVEPMYQIQQKEQKEKTRGEMNFFSLIEEEDTRFLHAPDVKPPTKMQMLKREKELLGFYLTGHPLDDSEQIMQKLSCVSLDQLDRLDKNAVFRACFVIETVAVKIASRSGRKFAIVVIGDGMIRHELPIWPDLFEEKSHLLIENQLIYAVLQKETDEDGNSRLQCRWLDDLTQMGEEVIRACDLAYDKARMQIKMSQFKNKAGRKSGEQTEEKKRKAMNQLTIKLNADKARLSEILKIKSLLRSQMGQSPVVLEFGIEGCALGKLTMDEGNGVECTEELVKKLKQLDAVIDILIETR